MFQSSPDSKVGCNATHRNGCPLRLQVSILTRLEGRVQRRNNGMRRREAGFQSSPDSKVGCNAGPPG